MTSQVETLAKRTWLGEADHVHFGMCRLCYRTHDENGKPLLVARQPRRPLFECLTCWEARQ